MIIFRALICGWLRMVYEKGWEVLKEAHFFYIPTVQYTQLYNPEFPPNPKTLTHPIPFLHNLNYISDLILSNFNISLITQSWPSNNNSSISTANTTPITTANFPKNNS